MTICIFGTISESNGERVSRVRSNHVENDQGHCEPHVAPSLSHKKQSRRKLCTMKLYLALIACIASLAAAREVPDLPSQANVPEWVLEKLIEKAALKKNWKPITRKVPKGSSSFVIGGEEVKVSDLEPVDDLFAPGAFVTVDGKKNVPKIFLYKSKVNPSIKVVLDNDKNLIKASRRFDDGNDLDLIHMFEDVFGEINADEDIDLEKLEEFEFVSSFRAKVKFEQFRRVSHKYTSRFIHSG